MKMLISVIIPTFNRAEKLTPVLEALNKQSLPPHNYEILFVDNNSSDDTRAVIESSIKKYIGLNIKYLFEGQQGLNFARNCGVHHAVTDIVAFLDDDAVPQFDWLQRLLSSYKDPKVGCVGGKIIPSFPKDIRLPMWLTSIFNGYFSGFDLGVHQIKELTEKDSFPYGANISFRKKAIISAGFFNPKLDRCGKNLIAGGETEMCIRVYRMGWKVLYNPLAVVEHIISPNRLKREYFFDHVKGEGITKTLIDYSMNNNSITYHHLFIYLYDLLTYIKKLFYCFHKRDKRFYYYLRIRVNVYALIYWFKLKYFGMSAE